MVYNCQMTLKLANNLLSAKDNIDVVMDDVNNHQALYHILSAIIIQWLYDVFKA